MIEIIIKDGYSEFDLKGTIDCTLFEVKSKARILAWEIEGNQLISYVIGKAIGNSVMLTSAYESLANHLRNGTLKYSVAKLELTRYLQLFASGTYQVDIGISPSDYEVIIPGVEEPNEYQNNLGFNKNKLWVGSSTIIYSIHNSMDENIIRDYVAKIKQGKKPQVLIISTHESEVHYLLSGYNAFMAYRRLELKPEVVRITKTNNYKISRAMLLNVFSRLIKNNDKELYDDFIEKLDKSSL